MQVPSTPEPRGTRLRTGEVDSFDEVVGLGIVQGDDGGVYPFHCTQIADGSRTIEAGAPVDFTIVAGHLGRWEASTIRRRR